MHKITIGTLVEIGTGTSWGGFFRVLEIRKTFANGKVAVVVDFHGERKVFNI